MRWTGSAWRRSHLAHLKRIQHRSWTRISTRMRDLVEGKTVQPILVVATWYDSYQKRQTHFGVVRDGWFRNARKNLYTSRTVSENAEV
jgi:hypothetical protein